LRHPLKRAIIGYLTVALCVCIGFSRQASASIGNIAAEQYIEQPTLNGRGSLLSNAKAWTGHFAQKEPEATNMRFLVGKICNAALKNDQRTSICGACNYFSVFSVILEAIPNPGIRVCT
jgi:hypothetical protein